VGRLDGGELLVEGVLGDGADELRGEGAQLLGAVEHDRVGAGAGEDEPPPVDGHDPAEPVGVGEGAGLRK
jgi:hypothetical protein